MSNPHKTPKDLVQQAAAYGIVREDREGRTAWYVDCSCGKEGVSGLPLNCLPATVAKTFNREGWTVYPKQQPKCPDCKKGPRMSEPVKIGPDPKIARKIYALLDEHFDDIKRMYRGSWTDDMVSKTLGVSLEIVISIRCAAYGELAEDPKLTKLKDDIELLRMEFQDEVQKLSVAFNLRLTALEHCLAKKSVKAAG